MIGAISGDLTGNLDLCKEKFCMTENLVFGEQNENLGCDRGETLRLVCQHLDQFVAESDVSVAGVSSSKPRAVTASIPGVSPTRPQPPIALPQPLGIGCSSLPSEPGCPFSGDEARTESGF